jgi:predicted transglutaminase-like cysteine proteinase
LRDLGVPIDDMRIVVLNDLNLRIAHAVLAVYVDADPYILDNQISQGRARELDPTTISRSIRSTKTGWWLHPE